MLYGLETVARTDEKTGGGDGGGRVEDVAIFISSHKNGQDQDDGYIGRRLLRLEFPGKRKAKKEVYGCGERGHG